MHRRRSTPGVSRLPPSGRVWTVRDALRRHVAGTQTNECDLLSDLQDTCKEFLEHVAILQTHSHSAEIKLRPAWGIQKKKSPHSMGRWPCWCVRQPLTHNAVKYCSKLGKAPLYMKHSMGCYNKLDQISLMLSPFTVFLDHSSKNCEQDRHRRRANQVCRAEILFYGSPVARRRLVRRSAAVSGEGKRQRGGPPLAAAFSGQAAAD